MRYVPEEDELEVKEDMLPGCCGVNVLHNASYSDKAVLLSQLKSFIADGGVDEQERGATPGLLLWTLTDQQKEEKAVILEVGFRPLETFTSPSTGNVITLYGLVLNQPKPRAAKGNKKKAKKPAKKKKSKAQYGIA